MSEIIQNLLREIEKTFHRSAPLTRLIESVAATPDSYWLVGGCLRDLLLDLPCADFDLVCSGDPTPLARKWGREVGGSWFRLDIERNYSRVVFTDGLQIDFSPLRAETLVEDLELRDFTINAMALALPDFNSEDRFFDPLDGLTAIVAKQLVPASQQSFSDDPLRLLKGIRHAVTLGFSCPDPVVDQMKSHSSLLDTVAGERLHDELLKIFASPEPQRGVELLIATGMLSVLFDAYPDTVKQSELQRQLGELFSRMQGLVQLEEEDRALFLLVKLFEYLAPANLTGLLHKRLRFSRRQQQVVEQLLTSEEKFNQVIKLLRPAINDRQLALIYELLQPCAAEKIIYYGQLSGRLANDQATAFEDAFGGESNCGRVADLLSGECIMRITKCSAGPHVKKRLAQIKLAEINGEIRTATDAEEWLRTQISD